MPGLLQSAIRAEIFALGRALQIVANFPGEVTIWTDCEAVVRKFHRLQAGHALKVNGSHFDLWTAIQSNLTRRPARTSLTKVAAHMQLDSATSILQEWCFHHNAIADRFAVAANFQRSDAFWELQARHSHACAMMRYYSGIVQSVQLAVSKEVVDAEKPVQVEQDPLLCELPLPTGHWARLPPPVIPPKAVRWYGDAVVRYIVSWFWFTVQDGNHPLVWISHFQLYIDYMLCTGFPGPVKLGGWKDGTDVSLLQLRGLGFKQRTRWFVKVLKETLRHQNIQMTMEYGRPQSHYILFHTGMLALPWPPERLVAVDQWLRAHSCGSFKRQSKALDALPYASKCGNFPMVPITSC